MCAHETCVFGACGGRCHVPWTWSYRCCEPPDMDTGTVIIMDFYDSYPGSGLMCFC